MSLGSIFTNKWMTFLVSKLAPLIFEQPSYVEFGFATRNANVLVPGFLRGPSNNNGAFDVSTTTSNGEILLVKTGRYSFGAKLQLIGGVASIARNSLGINANNPDVLQSVVPVTNQEFGLNWDGYLPAGTVIRFNANATPANNNDTQMFFATYHGNSIIK